MQCIVLQYSALYCNTLHCNTLYCIAVHRPVPSITPKMWYVFVFFSHHQRRPSRRLQYDRSNLLKAYNAVKEKRLPVKVAAPQFGVPVMTLRDRVLGKVSLETTKPGPDSLFSMQEELTLVEHLETMAQMGYGYTHAQLKVMADEYWSHDKCLAG